MPLTDGSMSRYWMLLSEAVELVRRTMLTDGGGEIIIPKLPSYNIMELGRAVWAEQGQEPDALFDQVGIRPGEKRHESMVSEDEAPWTYDCGDHYEIRHAQGVGPGGAIAKEVERGTRVPDGFRYRSDENELWLTKEKMVEMLEKVP